MSKKRNPNKKKFTVYFDLSKEKDATQMAMLEFCRIQSQLTIPGTDKPMGMGNFIRFMAVEFALRIEEAAKKDQAEEISQDGGIDE